MKYLDLPLELKTVNDAGTFDGYASVFGNVDQGGDVIERGAFKEIVKNDAGNVVVLWQHKTTDPIGVASVSQDDKGLHFSGHLVLEDPTARRAQAHMKAGSVRGMSIGFDVRPGGAEIMKSGIRKLTDLKLWEISLVTFGMNPLAQVQNAKQAGQLTTIREFEDFLRDGAGFSNAQAKLLASGGWKALQGQRDAGKSVDLTQLIDRIAAVNLPTLTV